MCENQLKSLETQWDGLQIMGMLMDLYGGEGVQCVRVSDGQEYGSFFKIFFKEEAVNEDGIVSIFRNSVRLGT